MPPKPPFEPFQSRSKWRMQSLGVPMQARPDDTKYSAGSDVTSGGMMGKVATSLKYRVNSSRPNLTSWRACSLVSATWAKVTMRQFRRSGVLPFALALSSRHSSCSRAPSGPHQGAPVHLQLQALHRGAKPGSFLGHLPVPPPLHRHVERPVELASLVLG